MSAAVEMEQAGLDDFTIYEKANRLGGTWRENTYPGIACDVPSHLYSYSFHPNPDWSHRFSPGGEIVTALVGRVADQAAFSGVVNTLYELHLPMLSTEWLGETDRERRGQDEAK